MKLTDRIYIAGHQGLVGSALLRSFERAGYRNLIVRTHAEVDLTDPQATERLFETERPDYVLLAAAKVGGILYNSTKPADFIRSNLAIALNVVDVAWRFHVKKLLFLGSSCIYPKYAPQPLKEEYLLSGPLEPTNEPYAVAKIAGIKLCQAYNRQYGADFVAVMPTNLYGPGDNFDLETSHVLPALIRKFHEAKMRGAGTVEVWGTGSPRREFLHVDDLADACMFIMQKYSGSEIINIGVGEDLSIRELTVMMREVIDFRGDVLYDDSKPDGTPQKLLDVTRLKGLGWQARIPLREGIASTYEWYCQQSYAGR